MGSAHRWTRHLKTGTPARRALHAAAVDAAGEVLIAGHLEHGLVVLNELPVSSEVHHGLGSRRAYFTPRGRAYAGLGAGTRLTGAVAPDFRAVAVVGASLGMSPEGGRR